jgi:hypothetical protein
VSDQDPQTDAEIYVAADERGRRDSEEYCDCVNLVALLREVADLARHHGDEALAQYVQSACIDKFGYEKYYEENQPEPPDYREAKH